MIDHLYNQYFILYHISNYVFSRHFPFASNIIFPHLFPQIHSFFSIFLRFGLMTFSYFIQSVVRVVFLLDF